MESLVKHITDRLADRSSCVVFEPALSRLWPARRKEDTKRADAIHAFAKAHGWSAVISDPGIRVNFKKLASPVLLMDRPARAPSGNPSAKASPKQKESADETRTAVGRIKKAVSETVDNMASEKAGTKAVHVPARWARKSVE